MTLPPNKTKIVCTIGPACESPEIMAQMMRAGMNVARLNFSHGSFEAHRDVITNLRTVARDLDKQLAILADLPGPKIRIGELESEPVELLIGDPFLLTTRDIVGDSTRASVAFEPLPQAVRPGDTIFLNDGYIQLRVESVEGQDVYTRVIVGGELRSRKGLNLPGIDLGISCFTPHDHDAMAFALDQGVDIISQSFVNTAADIGEVRRAAADLGYRPFIVAKIERSSALANIDEILTATDGIMIARGDLGVEIPIERIAVVQKQLMLKAVRLGRPVITATQMLESMTNNRRPTRSESTDVANAILDGTDCVMLSGESAIGRYPVESTAMLAEIAAETEPYRPAHDLQRIEGFFRTAHPATTTDLISLAVETMMETSQAGAVFVPTRLGNTVRAISRFRLPTWIVAASADEQICRTLQLSYGVVPLYEPDRDADWDSLARSWLQAQGIDTELALLVRGPSPAIPQANVSLEILDLRHG